MAYTVVAYTVMVCVGMAFELTALATRNYTGMAHTVMAYTAMACMVRA